MSEIKPIQTDYKGYRFRSRLEARWALCFDALGIEWDYEREGYELPSGWYLPDFYFPNTKTYAEVKSKGLTPLERQKVVELSQVTGCPVMGLVGPPDLKQYELYTCPADASLADMENIKPALSRLYRASNVSHEERYKQAVNISRSARFEHGETAKVPSVLPIVKPPVVKPPVSMFKEPSVSDFAPHDLLDIYVFQKVWPRFLDDAGKIAKLVQLLLSKAYPQEMQGNELVITFSARMNYERMNEPSKIEFVQKLLAHCTGISGFEVRFNLDAYEIPVQPAVPKELPSIIPSAPRVRKPVVKRDPLAELLALDTLPEIPSYLPPDAFGNTSWSKPADA